MTRTLWDEVQGVGPLVESGDHVDGLDDTRVRPVEWHDRLDFFEFLRMRRDGGEEVPLDGGDRIEPRLGEDEFVELFSVARIDMRGGWILRPVAGSTVSTCPLKTTVLTVLLGCREYLADCAYRDLGDDGTVEALGHPRRAWRSARWSCVS